MDISRLLEARKLQAKHFDAQRHAYLSEIDALIGDQLRSLRSKGVPNSQLQKIIQSKNYGTLQHYLSAVPRAHEQPIPLGVLLGREQPANPTQAAPPYQQTQPTQTTQPYQPHIEPTHPDNVTPAAMLKDFLTVDVENRRITLTEVPYSAWSERTRNRPDLYPLDPTDEKKYSGWANVTSSFLIGERSEAKSPFISENKEGGQLTKSVLKQLLGAE